MRDEDTSEMPRASPTVENVTTCAVLIAAMVWVVKSSTVMCGTGGMMYDIRRQSTRCWSTRL